MVPARVVFLKALPVTANGKIDRRALPAPGRSRPNLDTPFVSARTPLEKDLAQVWCEVLELDEIGIHDNFLDLGGHSLTATRIVSQVIGKYQIQIPLRSLFQSPTIADMAAILEQQEKSEIACKDLAQLLDQLDSCGEEKARLLVQSMLHQEKNSTKLRQAEPKCRPPRDARGNPPLYSR